jgi:hypothetical protein
LTISKQRVLQILDTFPATITLEDLIDRLILIAKIETALEQVKNGEYLTEEELNEKVVIPFTFRLLPFAFYLSPKFLLSLPRERKNNP